MDLSGAKRGVTMIYERGVPFEIGNREREVEMDIWRG